MVDIKGAKEGGQQGPRTEPAAGPVVSKDSAQGGMKVGGLEQLSTDEKVKLLGIVAKQIESDLGGKNPNAPPPKRRRVLTKLAEEPDSYKPKPDKGKGDEKSGHKAAGRAEDATDIPQAVLEGRSTGKNLEEANEIAQYWKNVALKNREPRAQVLQSVVDRANADLKAGRRTVGDLTSEELDAIREHNESKRRQTTVRAPEATRGEAVDPKVAEMLKKINDNPGEALTEVKSWNQEDTLKLLIAVILENQVKGKHKKPGAPEGAKPAAAAAGTAAERGTKPEKKTQREQALADAKKEWHDAMLAYVGAGLGWGNLRKDLTGKNADKEKFRTELSVAMQKYKNLRVADVQWQVIRDKTSQTDASRDATGKTKAERLADDLMYEFGEGAFQDMKKAEQEVHMNKLHNGNTLEKAGAGAKHIVDAYRKKRNKIADWIAKKAHFLHEDIGEYNKDASLYGKAKWYYQQIDNAFGRAFICGLAGIAASVGSGGLSKLAMVPLAGEGYDAGLKQLSTWAHVKRELWKKKTDEKYVREGGKVNFKRVVEVVDKRADAQIPMYEKHKKVSRIMTAASYVGAFIYASWTYDSMHGGGGKAPEDHAAGPGRPEAAAPKPAVAGDNAATEPGSSGLKVDIKPIEPAEPPGFFGRLLNRLTGSGEGVAPADAARDGAAPPAVPAEAGSPGTSTALDSIVRDENDSLGIQTDKIAHDATQNLDRLGAEIHADQTPIGGDAPLAPAAEPGGGLDFDEIRKAINEGDTQAAANLSPEDHRAFMDNTFARIDDNLQAVRDAHPLNEADYRTYMDETIRRIDENLNAIRGGQPMSDADHRAFIDNTIAKIDENLNALKEGQPMSDADHRAFMDEHLAKIDENLRALRESDAVAAPDAETGDVSYHQLPPDGDRGATTQVITSPKITGEEFRGTPTDQVDRDAVGGDYRAGLETPPTTPAEPTAPGAGAAGAGSGPGTETAPAESPAGEVAAVPDHTAVINFKTEGVGTTWDAYQQYGVKVLHLNEAQAHNFAGNMIKHVKGVPDELKMFGADHLHPGGNVDNFVNGQEIPLNHGAVDDAIRKALDKTPEGLARITAHNKDLFDYFRHHPDASHTSEGYKFAEQQIARGHGGGGGVPHEAVGRAGGGAEGGVSTADYLNSLTDEQRATLNEQIDSVTQAVTNSDSGHTGGVGRFADDAATLGIQRTPGESTEDFVRRAMTEAAARHKENIFLDNVVQPNGAAPAETGPAVEPTPQPVEPQAAPAEQPAAPVEPKGWEPHNPPPESLQPRDETGPASGDNLIKRL